MMQNYLCVAIPEELQVFSKEAAIVDNSDKNRPDNFGVKQLKDADGNLTGTAYYSNSGELIKNIYYQGSSISKIEHYRNNTLFSVEEFETGKLTTKTLYNAGGIVLSIIKYSYNPRNDIIIIQKNLSDLVYAVVYGYDELYRVNSRKIKVGGNIINEQNYRYDILDRIVEYSDNNQRINVHKVNPFNELISYTITDVIGNRIEIDNKFLCSEYIGTDIILNGHKTSVKDKMYLNNVMLKKPYTSEDDLDFALSNLIKIPKINSDKTMITKRETDIYTDKLSNFIILNQKEKESAKPISAGDIKFLNI